MLMLPLFNTLNVELNPICPLVALLGTHPTLQISKIRVNIGFSGNFVLIVLTPLFRDVHFDATSCSFI
jgi:hypothetical protein